MMTARRAKSSEASMFATQTGYETENLVVMEGDRILGRGQLCSAMGQTFGHGWHVESENARAAAVLWAYARSIVRDRGEEAVFLHFDDETPERIRQFWERFGAVKVLEIYRLEL